MAIILETINLEKLKNKPIKKAILFCEVWEHKNNIHLLPRNLCQIKPDKEARNDPKCMKVLNYIFPKEQ